jgi:hypothetical protein
LFLQTSTWNLDQEQSKIEIEKNKKSLEPVSGRQQNPNRNNKKSLPSAMPVRTSSNATRRCAKVA